MLLCQPSGLISNAQTSSKLSTLVTTFPAVAAAEAGRLITPVDSHCQLVIEAKTR
jgi:hypothetical protein